MFFNVCNAGEKKKRDQKFEKKNNTLPVASVFFKDEMNPHFRDVLYGETKN
jgi:hypothetical protein